MDVLTDFLTWAWARHHNPLSWYIQPLFIAPFCYFAYERSMRGSFGTTSRYTRLRADRPRFVVTGLLLDAPMCV